MGITLFIAGFIVSLILAIYFGFFADDKYYPLVVYPISFNGYRYILKKYNWFYDCICNFNFY